MELFAWKWKAKEPVQVGVLILQPTMTLSRLSYSKIWTLLRTLFQIQLDPNDVCRQIQQM